MHVINARNVNEALPSALYWLSIAWVDEESRNGAVRVAPGPVCTVYERPMERVLFHPLRDANPFFHLIEGLWMLAGRNDIASITPFNSGMVKYSDDGVTLNGAYGFRWREWFSIDQLQELVVLLKTDPETRRAVLAMWSAQEDLGASSKDIPCNTHVYFDLRGGVLNMTVCCRSNDALWGCYGANVVHFSMLQEYMAANIGVPIGVYRQFSNNLHVYKDIDNYERFMPLMVDRGESHLYYSTGYARPMSMFGKDDPADFDADLRTFFDPEGDAVYRTQFFMRTAVPLRVAYRMHKRGGTGTAVNIVRGVDAQDWAVACAEWLERRAARKAAAR